VFRCIPHLPGLPAESFVIPMLRNYLDDSGLNPAHLTNKQIAAEIKRRRPRGSGSKSVLAKKYRKVVQATANRRWKKKLVTLPFATCRMLKDAVNHIEAVLAQVQHRARARLLGVDDVLALMQESHKVGYVQRDGGKITCGSYGYSWSTTTARARRQEDGQIRVEINRDGKGGTISVPAQVFEMMSAYDTWKNRMGDPNVIIPESYFDYFGERLKADGLMLLA